ncbi:MAG TPA: hypothetical protein VGD51_03195 [Nocardioidaceae bacterium]
MVRAEQRPGRRRAEPPPRRLRRSSDRGRNNHPAPKSDPQADRPTPPPEPARPARSARPAERARPSKPPKSPRPKRSSRLLFAASTTLWLALLAIGLVAVVAPWTPIEVPDFVPLAGAVTITTLFTHGLAVRSGGRALVSGVLALVLAGGAAFSQNEILLAGATVGTAVVSALLAVLSTTPAAKFSAVVREVTVAAVVAVIGAFAVRAYGAEVSLERTGYLAIGFSLIAALALVYRLGAGLTGLGRRGLVMIISGVALLTITLAYTEALAAWGSPAMIETIDDTFARLSELLGAVPRPIEVLLGFPALAWGVSTRARRRQGWWVCAFGAPGMSVIAVSLLDPDVALVEAGLSVLYSLGLGLLVGYGIIRADLFLTGARGRRARQLEELAAHRPEPGRLQPLL